MKRLILGACLLCLSAASQADVYGLVNGRTADVRSEPQTTAELGISLEGDLTTLGGQVNFKVSPDSLIYATIANVDADNGGDDLAFGGGVVYQIDQNMLSGVKTAIKGSYHLWDYSSGGFSFDASDFGVELIVSPEEQNLINGANVFAMVGLHRLAADSALAGGGTSSNSSTELAFGAGVSMGMGAGEAYAAVEFIDELFIGAGFRLAIGR